MSSIVHTYTHSRPLSFLVSESPVSQTDGELQPWKLWFAHILLTAPRAKTHFTPHLRLESTGGVRFKMFLCQMHGVKCRVWNYKSTKMPLSKIRQEFHINIRNELFFHYTMFIFYSLSRQYLHQGIHLSLYNLRLISTGWRLFDQRRTEYAVWSGGKCWHHCSRRMCQLHTNHFASKT